MLKYFNEVSSYKHIIETNNLYNVAWTAYSTYSMFIIFKNKIKQTIKNLF